MNIIGKKVERAYGSEVLEGIIIAVSTDYEELSIGVGQFPCFVVMKDDGEVIIFPCVNSVIKDARL